MNFKTKFSIAHFPQGTIFELNPEFLPQFNGENRQFEVDYIAQNGAQSFVLQTTTINDIIDRPYAFNIIHVKRIVKRGQGEVKVYNSVPDINLWQDFSQRKSKTHYAVLNLTPFILSLIYRYVPITAYIDLDQAVESLKEQGFVKTISNDSWYSHYLVNKKKVKKWLRQNANRLILSIKAAEKYENELYSDLTWD